MTKKKTIFYAGTIAICLAIFLIITILILTKNQALENFDTSVFEFLMPTRNDFFNYMAVILSILGSTKVIAFVCIVLLLLPSRKRLGIPLFVAVFISAIINLAIKLLVTRTRPVGYFLISAPLGYSMPTSFSFPSGHAQNATIFYFSLAYLISKIIKTRNANTRNAKKHNTNTRNANINFDTAIASSIETAQSITGKSCTANSITKNDTAQTHTAKFFLYLFATLLSASTSLSRVYLGVHFFSDVLCGLLLATSLLCSHQLMLNHIKIKKENNA